MLSHLNRRSIAPVIVMLSMLLTLVVAAPVAAKKNPPGGGRTVARARHGRTRPAVAAAPGMLLPDTAMDPATGSLTVIAGVLLVGGTATLGTVAIRRQRSRRS